MLKAFKSVLLFSVLIPGLFLSCIQYQETMTLKPDGSGIIEFKTTAPLSESEFNTDTAITSTDSSIDKFGDSLPNLNPEEQVRKLFNKAPGIKVLSKIEYIEQDQKVSKYQISFDSPEVFADAAKINKVTNFVGNLSYKKSQDNKFLFYRLIDIRDPNEKDKEADEFTRSMMLTLFAGVQWVYTVEFPGKVLAANTSIDLIEGSRATWKYPFSQLLLGEVEMKAVLEPPPLNPIFIGVAVFIGLMLIIGLVMAVKSKRGSSSK
jgi:hypothetical protein